MANISMSIAGNISPILFLTFKELYGISYSLLGTLVLINFVTQLGIDLIFSFFSNKFNIKLTLKLMPFISASGFIVYALSPFIFPKAVYFGLVLGTIIFSFGTGLAEVLISPTIAAIPSKEPDREMSKLHSAYAWGVVGFVISFTVLIFTFGNEYWQIFTLLITIIPIICAVLFIGSEIPNMVTHKKTSGALNQLKNKGVWLCVIGIFLGGAAECTMAQWSSSYIEKALNVPKIFGDIFGVALFGAMLGLGRTLYTKYGKNISKVLILGAVGATVCYIAAAISNIALIGLLACSLTGLCTSMMWPGSLITATDRYPNGGVFIFALMAAGGDLGASVGPQLVGIITDYTYKIPNISNMASTLNITAEQLSMKFGLIIGMLFPLVGIIIYSMINKWYINNKKVGTE
jgi:MFS family permease